MLGNAGETEFDLRFQMFGIPVRVHPLFWLAGAFLWWFPTRPDLTFIGVICVFVSILVHELGHAVMFRRYGYRGEIVLYLMGGYATGGALSTWKNVIVSAAGPGAGFIFYGVVVIVGSLIPEDLLFEYDRLVFTLRALEWINLWWGIINLTPCLPLDGGHISQALIYRYSRRRADIKILWTSIISSGTIAFWGAQRGDRFMMIMFGLFCAQHVIALNQRNQFR